MDPNHNPQSSVRMNRSKVLSSLRPRRPSPSALRQLSTRPHPLASKATPRGPVLAGKTPPSLQSRQQKWSTLTALIIATFTGATTFVVGLQTGKGEAETKLVYKEPTQEGFKSGMKDLEGWLPADCIATDRETLLAHGHSDWACECSPRVGRLEARANSRADHDPTGLPGAVLYPRSTEDVVRIVKLAGKLAIPLIPFSGGTSLEGALSPRA